MQQKAIFDMDTQGTLTYVSKAFVSFFSGPSPRRLPDCLSREMPEAVITQIQQTIAAMLPWQNYVIFDSNLCRTEWVELTLIPKADGGYSGSIVSAEHVALFKTKLQYAALKGLERSRMPHEHIRIENRALEDARQDARCR